MFSETHPHYENIFRISGKQVEAVKQKVKEAPKIPKKVTFLKADNPDKLQIENKKLKAENGELKAKILTLKAENRKLMKVRGDFSEEVGKLEDELESKNEKILKVEEYVKKMKDNAIKREDHLLEYCDELFEKNEQLKAQLKDLEFEQGLRVEELEVENEQLKAQLKKFELEQDLRVEENMQLKLELCTLKKVEVELQKSTPKRDRRRSVPNNLNFQLKLEDELEPKNEQLEAQVKQNEQLKIQHFKAMRIKEAERKKKISEMEKKKKEAALNRRNSAPNNLKMERLTIEWKKRAAQCAKNRELEEMLGEMSMKMEDTGSDAPCELDDTDKSVVTVSDVSMRIKMEDTESDAPCELDESDESAVTIIENDLS